MIKRCATFVSLALAAASSPILRAQTIEIPDWEHSVRFELVSSQEPVRPGDQLQIALVAEIEPGYHLYGPEEQKPSRTELLVSGESIEAGGPVFPPVIRRDLAGLGQFDLYEGKIAIRVPIAVDPAAPDHGEIPVSVNVHYQVCTDSACSAPTSKTLTLKMTAAKPGSPVEKRHREVFAAPSGHP